MARLGVTATLGLLLLPQGAYGSSGALPSDEWNCVFVPARDLTGCSIANHSAHNHDRVHDWPGPGAFVTVEEQSMNVPFPVSLEGARTAAAVPVDQPSDLSAALAALGLHAPRLVVVLVGGAGRMRVRDLDRLRPLFEQGLVPGAERLGVVVVDGGTDAGVMHLLGRARTRAGAKFPLVGVPAVGTVRFPGRRFGARRRWPLDAHHTHFVLVPGAAWGDEAPWIARVATELAGGSPSVTVLVNGGKVAYKDVACSLQVGRPVLTVAGSGRTADQLASAVRGGPADGRAVRLAASGLVEVVNADDLAALQDALGARLQPLA